MPKFNDLDVVDFPYDYFAVVSFRVYLDNVNEQLQFLDKATPPPKYVTHTPSLFEAWYEWYDKLPEGQPDKQTMKPMGVVQSPDWCKYEFKGLEDFYQHYNWLTQEVD